MQNCLNGNEKIVNSSTNHFERLVVESSLILQKPYFNNMRSTPGIDNLSADLILNSYKLKNVFPP